MRKATFCKEDKFVTVTRKYSTGKNSHTGNFYTGIFNRGNIISGKVHVASKLTPIVLLFFLQIDCSVMSNLDQNLIMYAKMPTTDLHILILNINLENFYENGNENALRILGGT